MNVYQCLCINNGILLFSILPESIKWLISKKRYDEARDLILKAAKMNGKVVPKHLLIAPTEDEQVDLNIKLDTCDKSR